MNHKKELLRGLWVEKLRGLYNPPLYGLHSTVSSRFMTFFDCPPFGEHSVRECQAHFDTPLQNPCRTVSCGLNSFQQVCFPNCWLVTKLHEHGSG